MHQYGKTWATSLTILSKSIYYLLTALLMVSVAQAQLLGPVNPPPLGAVFTQTGTPHDGLWGRAGGKTFSFSNVNHANNTPVFWGVASGAVRLSLDGSDYAGPGEIMSYDPGLSDLPNGLVVWSGQTTIITEASGAQTAYTRFQTVITDGVTTLPVALTLATDQGLAADVGGIFEVINSAASFDVNLLFTASLDEVGPYTPHLDFFDPLTGIDQDGKAHSSLSSGFYYVNTPPFMTTIVNVEVNEGATAVVDSSHLVAQDFESGPDGLTYTLNPEDQGGIPQHGELDNLGTPLATFDTFTQTEVNAGAISYTHDGTETTLDSYVFTVHDEQGAIAADGPFTLFKNTINVTTSDDPPTAQNGSGIAGVDGVYNGTLEGEDEESTLLEFSIISVDVGAALMNDINTGSFTYTGPNGYVGDAIITFQVWDGNSFAIIPGEFTVTVPVNEPPTAQNGSGTAGIDGVYNGTLEGEDLEGKPLEFSVVSVDVGAALMNDINTGSFTYTGPNGYAGDAIITFQVWDGNSFAIVPGEFTVTVPDPSVAVVHTGDLLIANGDLLILHNLPENTDWVLSSGDNFTSLTAIAFDGESQIYVLDRANGLIQVDPVSGAQTVIATGDNFATEGPGSIAVEDINHVLVANLDFSGAPSILRVDTTNGNISTLSSDGLIPVPTATTVGADGKVYVTDASAFMGGTSGIAEIDPANGSQTTVSLGDLIKVPFSIAVEVDGNIIVADAPAGLIEGGVNRILRIIAVGPPENIGSQSILSEGGQILASLTDVTTGFNRKIYAANGTNVLDIDPVTGAQAIVATEAVVTAPTDVVVVFRENIFSDSFEEIIPNQE